MLFSLLWCGVKRLFFIISLSTVLEMNFLLTAVLSKLWSGIYGIKSIICISQIPRYASLMYATYFLVMCRSQYPPNFSKKENGKDQNSVSCTKKNILFLVSTRNDNISRGCATKTEFPEGRGGPFWESIFGKSRGEGGS